MIPRLVRRALARDGNVMIVVMLCMLVVTGIALAAEAAADGDVFSGVHDSDGKRAYAAAEAGLAFYLNQLGHDNDYWLRCDQVPPVGGQPAPVNQPLQPGASDTRVWRVLPTDPDARYTVELLPVRGTTCQTNDDSSMLSSSGTLKIRTTGMAGAPGKQVKRSIVSTLRRNGFLDYLYFTDYEEPDPSQQVVQGGTDYSPYAYRDCSPADARANLPSCPTITMGAWIAGACTKYVRQSRDSVVYTGSVYARPSWATTADWYSLKDDFGRTVRCDPTTIRFVQGDGINGPFHTNDTMRVCGAPTFGRSRNGNGLPPDYVDFYAWRGDPNCSGNAADTGDNTVRSDAKLEIIKPPTTNEALKQEVAPGYVFSGVTTIQLQGTTMSVNGGAPIPLPDNGVLAVENSGYCPAFDPAKPYPSPAGCGDVFLQGTYAKNLTITADRDIVVSGDVLAATGSNALLGLIATNFVRVQHRMASMPCSSTTANADGEGDRTIQAAILSLNHVFTVDNPGCGPKLGVLHVKGGIAQKYRGPVGQGSGSGMSGYLKDYQYDDRLKLRSPPHFLAPVQSAWKVIRTSEQSPAT
jgi:hypothetical protein